jgi:hypothetical protein
MKKILILVLLMTTLPAGGVFAQEEGNGICIGIGISFIPLFGEYKYDSGKYNDSGKWSGFDIGLYWFIDITSYIEANLGLLFGSSKDEKDDKGIDTTTLNLGLIGKLPIPIDGDLVFFPFAGMDLNVNLAAKNVNTGNEIKDGDDYKKSDDFNVLSILFGIGVDFDFLRFEIGYGIVLNTKNQNDRVKESNGDLTYTKGKIPIKIALRF